MMVAIIETMMSMSRAGSKPLKSVAHSPHSTNLRFPCKPGLVFR
jgi:hypothetical protein